MSGNESPDLSSFGLARRFYQTTAKLYRRKLGVYAKKRIAAWSKILNLPDSELDREGKIRHYEEYFYVMMEELENGIKTIDGEIQEPDDKVVQEYSTDSLNDRRALYVSQIMVQNEESKLSSSEIRVLLSSKENKHIYRSQVGRVIKAIPKFLSAKIDKYSGKLRVVRNEQFFNTNLRNRTLRSGGG